MKKLWGSLFIVLYLDLNILGVLGPGSFNQAPTLRGLHKSREVLQGVQGLLSHRKASEFAKPSGFRG